MLFAPHAETDDFQFSSNIAGFRRCDRNVEFDFFKMVNVPSFGGINNKIVLIRRGNEVALFQRICLRTLNAVGNLGDGLKHKFFEFHRNFSCWWFVGAHIIQEARSGFNAGAGI